MMTKVFAILAVGAIATHADEATDPAPVRLTEKALTTEQAQSVQKAWAEHIGIEVAYENSIGMQLRVIPPGTYRIIPRRAKDGDKGPVEATLSQAYLMGQFEVTQGEWKRVMGPIKQELDAGAGDRFPIYRINHAEATEFCRKLTELERKAGKLPEGYEYRLPTGSEREWACRAGTLTRYHFGEKMSSRLANYDGTRPLEGTEEGPNLPHTVKVGSYPANAWGLHDMHGNLAEWCMDWFSDKEEGGVDPVRLEPSAKWEGEMVIRGSGWGYPGVWTHSANRYHLLADVRRPTIGFRPVLSKLQPGRVVEPEKEKET